MASKEKISPLLQALVKDNLTYKFPVESILKELVQMFLNREEFEYFNIQAFRKLKKEFGATIAHIYITTIEIKLHLQEIDIHTIPIEEYHIQMEEFISTLERLYITRIEKDSPDGELLSAIF